MRNDRPRRYSDNQVRSLLVRGLDADAVTPMRGDWWFR